MTRINARLDADLAHKLRVLREQTGQSTSEIVKTSIRSYYQAVAAKGMPGAGLAELVGCADGSPDLSTSYKQELGRLLGRKHRA
jgi:hypothetical protein